VWNEIFVEKENGRHLKINDHFIVQVRRRVIDDAGFSDGGMGIAVGVGFVSPCNK